MAATVVPDATTSANLDDPFVETQTQTPPHAHPSQPLRHAPFNPHAFMLHAESSPKQARLALEAHMKETDRRIQEASKLGSTLVSQRKELASRLKELGEKKDTDEIGPDLQKKLAELEKEYTDVGRETARAVLPKSRMASSEMPDPGRSPAVFAGVSGASPSKVAVPSRKLRNQTSNRVHDIEFATEISTSLLAQVRSLQAALVEKDDALKLETAERSHLEAEFSTLRSRLRHLDENEQKYKEENWNLETQMQDMTAAMKTATEREQRANQSLKTAHSEREAILRELEELKQNHGKLTEDYTASKRSQEGDMHMLRRDLASHEHERDQLQKKVDELTSQNTELARAISYRMNGDSNGLDHQFGSGDDEFATDREFSEHSPPGSPTKRGPGQGVLETETLRSSIQHAHRMIQTLKNNIHREKTEKLELKRMLQDARDELETRRGDSKASNLRNRKSVQDAAKLRRARAEQLGSNRVSREEIINDPDWEDHEGPTSFFSSTTARPRKISMPGAFLPSEESTDAFETAEEKETATETEAFQTGNEAFEGESSGDATETEGRTAKTGKASKRLTSFPSSIQSKRASYMSTASTSADEEDEDTRTPITGQQKYKVRNIKTRSFLRDGSASANNSPAFSAAYRNSPAFSQNSSNRGTPVVPAQSLGDELDGLSDQESSVGGTPSKRMTMISTPSSPLQDPYPAQAGKTPMVDSGTMTEPWEPKAETDKSGGIMAAAAGALGGLGLGSLVASKSDEDRDAHVSAPDAEPTTPKDKAVFSSILSRHTEPVRPATPERSPSSPREFAAISSQNTEPVQPPPQPASPRHFAAISSQNTEPLQRVTVPHSFAAYTSQATEPLQRVPVPHSFAAYTSQETEPVSAPKPEPPRQAEHSFAPVKSLHTEPRQAEQRETTNEVVQYSMSPIKSQSYEPWSPSDNGVLFPPRLSSRRPDGIFGDGSDADDLLRPRKEEKANSDRESDKEIRTDTRERVPFSELSNNAASVPAKPTKYDAVTSDEGTQTMVSSQEIDSMLRNKAVAAPPTAAVSAQSPPRQIANTSSPRRSSEPGLRLEAAPLRRPGSSGSMRRSQDAAPPLPPDHSEKIALATNKPLLPSFGSMGPPLLPASAYRAQQRDSSVRSRTSTINTANRVPVGRNGPANGSARSEVRSPVSRRSSVSSFASEVDHRLNPNGVFSYPADLPPATDPRMITAITQTMIGEYLWKYTRSPLSSSTISSNRHRRFFWVHPYTRTLYWSENDPSAAGKQQLRAKSVAIEAVRVIQDDNAYPPGLCAKSLVVVTPAREIVFTAPTSQRHETWFNALSYLLLRTGPATQDANTSAAVGSMTSNSPAVGQAQDVDEDDDIAEFNPQYASNRPTARSARQSHVSVGSHSSAGTARSHHRPHAYDVPTLTPTSYHQQQRRQQQQQQQSATVVRRDGAVSPSPLTPSMRSPSLSGRFSSMMRTVGRRRSTSSRRQSDLNSDGLGGEVGQQQQQQQQQQARSGSAEDVRRRIEEEERRERMENVRSCCDGRHDVGTLGRTPDTLRARTESLRGRSGQGHAHPAHPPPPPPRDPASMSSR